MDRVTYDKLTSRERDCLRLAGRGFKAAEIGGQLALSEGHVENVIKRARGKLGGAPRHVAARDLIAFEQVQSLDVQAMDLPEFPVEQPLLPGRHTAGANAVREERASFEWDTMSVQPDRTRPVGRWWTLAGIAAVPALVGLCLIIAYPMSEGVQRLVELIASLGH